MTNYTEEEIKDFIYSKAHYPIGDDETMYLKLILNSIGVLIKAEIVMDILKNCNYRDFLFQNIWSSYYYIDTSACYKIVSILHKVHFNKLPLFISTYPEIVAWRLRIGK